MNDLSLDKYDLEYFDPINISKKIEEDYERYLYSSFPLRNDDFFTKFKMVSRIAASNATGVAI